MGTTLSLTYTSTPSFTSNYAFLLTDEFAKGNKNHFHFEFLTYTFSLEIAHLTYYISHRHIFVILILNGSYGSRHRTIHRSFGVSMPLNEPR